MTTYLVVTESFEPLVSAQARARKIETRLIVVKHPVGGLNTEELSERIQTASVALTEAITQAA